MSIGLLGLASLLLSSCGGGSNAKSNISAPLKVSWVRIPEIEAPNFRTSGSYPAISGQRKDVDLVNTALHNEIVRAERRYARFVRRAESKWPRALRKHLNRVEHGIYRALPHDRRLSASTVVVSTLIPVLALLPGGTDGETWISVTLRYPSGTLVRLTNLFKDRTGLVALAARVRKLAVDQDRCIRASVRSPITGNISLRGFLPLTANYRFFALTQSGLVVGFPNGQVAFPGCGRIAVTVPFDLLEPYLSDAGKTLVAGVRRPL